MIGFLKWEGGTWAEEELWWLVWGRSRCGGNGKEEGNLGARLAEGCGFEWLGITAALYCYNFRERGGIDARRIEAFKAIATSE